MDFGVSGKLGERRGEEEGFWARVHERTQFQFRGLLPFSSRQGLPGLLRPGPRLRRTCPGLNWPLGEPCHRLPTTLPVVCARRLPRGGA